MKSYQEIQTFSVPSSKNNHGRELFLSVQIKDSNCYILEFFYTDRNQGKTGVQRRKAKPKLLTFFNFPADELLDVISEKLDKSFVGIEFVTTELSELTTAEYIKA